MSEEQLETTEEEQQPQDEQVQEETQPDNSTSDEQPTAQDEPDILAMSDEEYEEYVAKKEATKPSVTTKADDQEQPEVKDTPEEAPEQTPVKAQDKSSEGESNQPIVAPEQYKSFYDSVMKPFKANGKEITPRSLDDVISLMQMGANYTKKMQLLAPMRKTAETIRKSGMTEADLNTMIDVFHGNKGAIKELMKKHNINPMDFDMDSDEQPYTPGNNIASDSDVEFANTITDIDSSLPKIRDIMDNKWDEKSKMALLRDPRLLTGLHQEIQMGRFDAVQEVLEEEKAMGRYSGMSDLEAYMDIVNKYVQWQQQQAAQQAKQPIVAPKPKQPTKEQQAKFKAAPTKAVQKPKTRKVSDADLLSMSDEEFEKLSGLV